MYGRVWEHCSAFQYTTCTFYASYYFSSSRQLVFEDAGSHGNTENIPPQLMDQLQPAGLHTNQSLNSSRTPNSCNTSQKNAESFDKVRTVKCVFKRPMNFVNFLPFFFYFVIKSF